MKDEVVGINTRSSGELPIVCLAEFQFRLGQDGVSLLKAFGNAQSKDLQSSNSDLMDLVHAQVFGDPFAVTPDGIDLLQEDQVWIQPL